MLRQGKVNVVVVYAVDRLSRNQNHMGILLDVVELWSLRQVIF